MSYDDLLPRILSKDSLDRLNRIKILNKTEGIKLESLVINKFNVTRRFISDDEFMEIVNENEKQKQKMEVVYKRRNRDDDLEEI
ncbi:Pdcd5 programmed cell death 5 protein [Tubulinosema ratisbonensis]|uniref:Pdcd5 programmed cell death 5 protein n=1 Tax=Tubulinosema ratisbonensis TaxID=291195 RepID=A0A437AMP8_9MICR|nr:Pdcd5 programmed cell death 5 protein [Tubulinosema ratisbonensis]